MQFNHETFTFTFSECVENHHGNQTIGTCAAQGFTFAELEAAAAVAEAKDYKCERIDVQENLSADLRAPANKASVLVIRRGVELLIADYKNFVATTIDINNQIKSKSTLISELHMVRW